MLVVMSKHWVLSLVARWVLVLSIAFGTTFSRAEDRSKIDPNTEKVLVTVGGINFDIPLGYFYEKTIWTKGAWPVPNKQRTDKKGSPAITITGQLRLQ